MVDSHLSSPEQDQQPNFLYVLESRRMEAEQAGKREAVKKMDAVRAKMEQEIVSDQGLQETIEQIEGYDRLHLRIRQYKFNYLDIQELEISGIEFFLDPQLVQQLRESATSMHFGDVIRHTLGPENHDLYLDANKAFEDVIEDLDLEIKKTGLLAIDDPQRKHLKYLEAQKAELLSQRKKWIQRKSHELRKEFEEGARFKQYIGLEQANKLKLMLEEARSIRLSKIREYANTRLEIVWAHFEQARQFLTDREALELAGEIGSISDECNSPHQQNLKKLHENIGKLRNVEEQVKLIKRETQAVQENRGRIESSIQKKHQRFLNSLEQIRMQYGDELRQRKGELSSENPRAVGSRLQAIELILGSKTPIKVNGKEVSILDAIHQANEAIKNLSSLDTGQILDAQHTIDTLNRTISDRLDAEKAHRAIEALNQARDSKEIRQALEQQIGTDHVRYISNDKFKSYQQYTHSGYMVYHQRGDEWEIIINKEATDDPSIDLDALKMQLRHELYHVKFERGGMTKDENGDPISIREMMEKELIKGNPAGWNEIRATFIDYVTENGDLDSHGRMDWPEEDILSELFAMQDELGKVKIQDGKGRGPEGSLSKLDILNNAVWAHGLSKTLKDELGDRILGYKKAAYEAPEDEASFRSNAYVEESDQQLKDMSTSSHETRAEDMNQSDRLIRQQTIDDLSKRIRELQEDPVAKTIPELMGILKNMTHYNENTQALNNLQNTGGMVDKRNAELKGDLGEISDKVTKVSSEIGNSEMGLFQRIWNNTSFMSINDFISAGKQSIEYIKRRLTRRGEDHAAKLNKAFWGGTGLGLEATAKEQQVEADEVGEWEKRYNLLDPSQLEALLHGVSRDAVPDRDQLKAIMRVLAGKGRLRWQNQDLWRTINKLQSKTYLRLGDPILLRDPNQLRIRLNSAISDIYDKDEFPTLEQKNASSYNSLKQQRDTVNAKTTLKLGQRLTDNLRDHINNRPIDPIDYESIIDYCVDKGLASGEMALFHLISGISRGILPPESGINMAKYAGKWPPIQCFADLQFSQKEFETYCKRHFPDDYENGKPGDQFRRWLFTYVMNLPGIRDRVEKSVGGRNWDPDWVRTVACIGDAEIIKQHLSGRAGQVETTGPAVEGTYVGILQYLEENAISPSYAGKEEFARVAGNIVMMEGIIDGTAFKTSGADNFARGVDNSSIPNEAGAGRYDKKSVGFHRAKLTHFLDMIDGRLFKMLRGREVTGAAKGKLAEDVKNYVKAQHPDMYAALEFDKITDSDQIFSKIREITKFLFKKVDFNALRNRIVSEAGKPPPGYS